MKQAALWMLVCILFGVQDASAQKLRHYFGIRPTYNQMNLHYSIGITNWWQARAEIGYQGRFKSSHTSALLIGMSITNGLFASYGYRTEIGTTFIPYKQMRIACIFTYKQTTIDKVVEDYSRFSGSNDAEYYAFWQENEFKGIKLLFEYVFLGQLIPYAGIGARHRNVTQHYIIGGNFTRRHATSGVYQTSRWLPTLHIGLIWTPLIIGAGHLHLPNNKPIVQ